MGIRIGTSKCVDTFVKGNEVLELSTALVPLPSPYGGQLFVLVIAQLDHHLAPSTRGLAFASGKREG